MTSGGKSFCFYAKAENFKQLEETGVEWYPSTPLERITFEAYVLLHGVEHVYSKILLQSGVERSSGVGVDPYTHYSDHGQVNDDFLMNLDGVSRFRTIVILVRLFWFHFILPLLLLLLVKNNQKALEKSLY